MSRRTSRRVAALEEEPPTRPKRGVPDPTVKKDEMTEDQVAELWAQFAADHFEVVEQLPLELHRNSRLLRELDSESLCELHWRRKLTAAQQTRLQARIREYIAYRIAVARPREMQEAGETATEVAQTEKIQTEEPLDVKPDVSGSPEAQEPQAALPDPPGETPLDVPPSDTRAASAVAVPSPAADGPPTTDAPAAADTPAATNTPAPGTPGAARAPEEAEEHAAEAAVEDALAEDPHTPRPSGTPAPPPYPKRVNLGEISSLISELVRNREEKVAIAVGAYNTIDRHIRALDSALSAQETSVLGFAPSAEPQPEPAPSPPKRGRPPKRTSVSASVPPTGLPPGIEADPNEPRYCYCNQVSYGEMVGCDVSPLAR
jgi:hypothetical protein